MKSQESFDPSFPDIPYLRAKAKKQIPGFAFEYVDGGCNSEINLRRNTNEIRDVQLKPFYLRDYKGPSIKTTLFGKEYAAPFGIAPIGLQGLIWPKAPEILAKAAFEQNIPYILSTVSTASIETIADLTEGNAWFQLYHPKEADLRDKLIQRADAAGCPVLVLLSDVPTFGYRSREIINGLSIPPRMSLRNILQVLSRPQWASATLRAGMPEFKTLKPYIPKGLSLKHLGLFMDQTFDGRLTPERIKPIRDQWKGKLVLKGIVSEEDVEQAIALGIDGLIVSNHGGRQLDAGESTIKPLNRFAQQYKDQITLMMDSGIRTGPDIACTLASGAQFAFLGRAFMYGVAALGRKGGDHTIAILKRQLRQVMEQLCCESVDRLPEHIAK